MSINTNIDIALTVQNRLYGILENGVHRDIAYTLRTKTTVVYESQILKIWSKLSASKPYVREGARKFRDVEVLRT